MKRITVRDAITVALALEKIGQAYYRKAATLTSDNNLIKMFESLANQEVQHEKYYRILIDHLEKNEKGLPAEEIQNKTAETISKDTSLIETLKELQAEVFDIKKIEAKIENIKTLDNFVEMAIDNEQRVVSFFTRLRNYISPKFTGEIDKIIAEEKTHVTQMLLLRKTIENILQ